MIWMMKLLLVLLLRPAENANVVQVHAHKVLALHEHLLHESLERARCVGEPEGQHAPLKATVHCRERGFVLAARLHA